MYRHILAVAALLIVLSPALAEDPKIQRTLALSGHGEVRMAPDLAVVMVGVLSQADSAGAALDANTAAMQAVFAALKASLIEEKDIQTSNFSVAPRYDYNVQPPRFIGYDVSNTVTVTLRKIATLGAVLDRVVASGSNQINGVQFQVSKPEAALDEARKLGVQDALRKARLYAAASLVTLGDVISISEGGGFQPPVPMQTKMMRAEGMADVPIAQGEQAISVDVSMVWEIK